MGRSGDLGRWLRAGPADPHPGARPLAHRTSGRPRSSRSCTRPRGCRSSSTTRCRSATRTAASAASPAPPATSTSASRSRCGRSATTARSTSISSASSCGASGRVATTSGPDHAGAGPGQLPPGRQRLHRPRRGPDDREHLAGRAGSPGGRGPRRRVSERRQSLDRAVDTTLGAGLRRRLRPGTGPPRPRTLATMVDFSLTDENRARARQRPGLRRSRDPAVYPRVGRERARSTASSSRRWASWGSSVPRSPRRMAAPGWTTSASRSCARSWSVPTPRSVSSRASTSASTRWPSCNGGPKSSASAGWSRRRVARSSRPSA